MNRWIFMKKVLKLHLTQTKVTTFYISLELKIRPKIWKVCQTRGRSRSFKNFSGKKSRILQKNIFFDFFFKFLWTFLRKFWKFSGSFKNISNEYSRVESVTWCNDGIYYNKLFEIPGNFWSFSNENRKNFDSFFSGRTVGPKSLRGKSKTWKYLVLRIWSIL